MSRKINKKMLVMSKADILVWSFVILMLTAGIPLLAGSVEIA